MTPELTRRRLSLAMLAVLGVGACRQGEAPQADPAPEEASVDPLSAWNDGWAKQRIVDFVRRVSQPGPDFVPAANRIAVFDNDGTLWVEQPLYTEFMFAIDRALEMARSDPSLASRPSFAKLVKDGPAAAATLTMPELGEIMTVTHTGVTQEQLAANVQEWVRTARHPRFGAAYTQLVYEPQLQLLAHLRANGFKTFIVSGGGVDFMRAWAPAVYGIPPEQIIGTSARGRFQGSEVVKTADDSNIDDAAGKPENIQLHIGQIPILAVGNSDGDKEMLEYTASNPRPNLEILIHHDDAAREYAYDRQSKVGRLDAALDEAQSRNWLVVSMKEDWGHIFPGGAADTVRVSPDWRSTPVE
jgi:hypothetical protein